MTIYRCLSCSTRLTPGMTFQARKTGRMICHRCRLVEVRGSEPVEVPFMTWRGALETGLFVAGCVCFYLLACLL